MIQQYNRNKNYSQQAYVSHEESGMNFSFSDVKTSVDKSLMFDRNMQILNTDYPQDYEMLEQAS